ncbi:hypothetical protein Dpep_0153 [Dethiosulfovibrio peptidovorans DSM 11002]|uniref:Type II secretion system protein GspN n=1 Tax=Dethiosulfovibrio peptidovorans DSM 11002 TaxID=469381 RepID=D2Z2W7_9BACT|nr:type II secretion system protein GspN [Dethiosulfovibrio peptidovorans]EFC90185.1 hypothetical protein Dpep_0153 [Dethiosulfovibrio peptidovorans DSM 11002]
MRRIRSVLAALLILSFGLIIGLRLFLPWEDLGELAFLEASRELSRSGIFLQASRFDDEGVVPVFVVDRVEMEGFGGGATFETVKVRPMPLRSIILGKPTASIELIGGAVSLPGDRGRRIGGSLEVSYGQGRITIAEIEMAGDIKASGSLSISPNKGRIVEADVTLKTPADLDGALSMASRFMPLSRNGEGDWILKRKGGK